MDVGATSQAGNVSNFASGVITSDGSIVNVFTGFKPRYVKIVNVTDVIVWEKFEGMTDAQVIKTVTAGTTTVDTGSAIVENSRGFAISAAAAGSAKSLSWVAFG